MWVLSLTDPQQRFPLIRRDFDRWQGQFSPDSRWVAYVSDESGRSEVLVRRFVTPSAGLDVLNHRSVTHAQITAVYDRYERDAEKRTALETWARTLAAIVDLNTAATILPFARPTAVTPAKG